MKQFIVFLHGDYRQSDIPFYKRLCKSKVLVAADGGFAFFEQAKLEPDHIVGDLDSIGADVGRLPDKTQIHRFPTDKDKTDGQLAIEFCLGECAGSIDLVMPSIDEPDHMLGNFLLLADRKVVRWTTSGGRIRIVNPGFEVSFLKNGVLIINEGVGDTVSAVILSPTARLTCRGMKFGADDVRVARGDTRSLRNVVTQKRARIELKGEALVVRQFGTRAH